MQVRELIEHLQEVAAAHGGDAEVRLAHQPEWPFEYELGTLTVVDRATDEEFPERISVVYLAEGAQLGYLPADGVEALGW